MTGLAHISRFSHETARRIIERPDLHGHEHLRAACTWLTIHGDWLDVNRAAALMRALDRGESPSHCRRVAPTSKALSVTGIVSRFSAPLPGKRPTGWRMPGRRPPGVPSKPAFEPPSGSAGRWWPAWR